MYDILIKNGLIVDGSGKPAVATVWPVTVSGGELS